MVYKNNVYVIQSHMQDSVNFPRGWSK